MNLLIFKKKEQLLSEMPDDFTQVTVLNKSDLLKKKIIRLMELQKKIGKQLTIILKIK